MTPLPLDQIRFGWRSHLAALWWLGLLYRKPKSFDISLGNLGSWRGAICGIHLYLHAMPWLFAISILGRLIVHGVLGVPSNRRC
jgi:hypothetical protein